MIGACVYFKRADTTEDGVLGLLKGLFWPASLVYEVFSAVSGRPTSTPE